MIQYSVQEFLDAVKLQRFTYCDVLTYPDLVPTASFNCDKGTTTKREDQNEQLRAELKSWLDYPSHHGRFKMVCKITYNHPKETAKQFIVDKVGQPATNAGVMQGTVTEEAIREKILQEQRLKDLEEKLSHKENASEIFVNGLVKCFEVLGKRKGINLQGEVVSDPAHPSQQPKKQITQEELKDEESKWEKGAEILSDFLNGDEFLKLAEKIKSDPSIVKILKTYIQ